MNYRKPPPRCHWHLHSTVASSERCFEKAATAKSNRNQGRYPSSSRSGIRHAPGQARVIGRLDVVVFQESVYYPVGRSK